MTLQEYKRKRNVKTTPEPRAKLKSKKQSKPLLFVVQKHWASHLHYDFRLEVNGVLKSWAIPKGPSLNPSNKRLAMMVEDHPFDYHNFEGIIPEGNYGAGTVMVWDEGFYVPLDENDQPGDDETMEKGLRKGTISFVLAGTKLEGSFTLIKMKRQIPNDNHWLFVKRKDPYAKKKDITKQDRSALTDRTKEEIEQGQ